jgi:hypothetical protein
VCLHVNVIIGVLIYNIIFIGPLSDIFSLPVVSHTTKKTKMSDRPPQSYNSFRGGGGRGRGNYNNNRGRGSRGRGRGRGGGGGGFHQQHATSTRYTPDVDYSPEAIEARFSTFYLPSMTQDPWQHLTTSQ